MEGRKALRVVVGAMVLFWLREKEASPSFEQMAVRGGQRRGVRERRRTDCRVVMCGK